jgi:hypothetical protein
LIKKKPNKSNPIRKGKKDIRGKAAYLYRLMGINGFGTGLIKYSTILNE